MQRSSLGAVALAVLLVTAGCNGILGSGSPTATPTDGPTPTGSPTPTPAGDTVPGVENGTLTDSAALLDAHQEGLLASGFETDVQVNATVVQGGEVVSSERRQRTVVEPGAREYRYRTVNSPGGGTIQFDHWANESVSVVRGKLGDTVRYQIREPQPARVLTARPVLDNYLNGSEARVVGVERAGGETLFTLRSTQPPTDPDALPANATNVRNYELRVVVDAKGRVHGMVASGTYDLNGEPATFRVAYDLVRADQPSVSQPKWAAQALANASSS